MFEDIENMVVTRLFLLSLLGFGNLAFIGGVEELF